MNFHHSIKLDLNFSFNFGLRKLGIFHWVLFLLRLRLWSCYLYLWDNIPQSVLSSSCTLETWLYHRIVIRPVFLILFPLSEELTGLAHLVYLFQKVKHIQHLYLMPIISEYYGFVWIFAFFFLFFLLRFEFFGFGKLIQIKKFLINIYLLYYIIY